MKKYIKPVALVLQVMCENIATFAQYDRFLNVPDEFADSFVTAYGFTSVGLA